MSVVHSLNIFPALVLQLLCFLLHEVARYLVMIKDESGVGVGEWVCTHARTHTRVYLNLKRAWIDKLILAYFHF